MARAYKCDRCGAYYDCSVTGEITTRRYDWGNAQREHDDLCEDCTRQLKEWFDAGKKEVIEDAGRNN